MKDQNTQDLSWDEFDELRDPRPETCDFDHVVDRALSRRGFLGGVLAFGSGAAAMGAGLMGSTSARAMGPGGRFGFNPIPIATDATIHVPEGYEWEVLVRWGDPLFSDAGAFDPATGGTAASQERAFGENTDGMEMFVVGNRQVIAVNNEYANLKINLPNNDGGMPASAEDVLKIQNTQGVSIMEVTETGAGWQVVVDSPLNRRITHNTPMRLSGPAAGHDLLKTAADATGTQVLGTLNNCGAGKTPWGTYLTCEENFNGYFGSTDAAQELPEAFKRYGIGHEGRYAYEQHDPRFDLSQNVNEPNRHGYIVEIDPADPESTPVKRTALGRFKHENAACVLASEGQVVVYMGDDERGEFLYKFVSTAPYAEGGDTSALLDEGQLYVARFSDDQTGEWMALTPEATGMTEAEIAILTRQAASALGATTMDRPEWVAVNPVAPEAYCALTNNKNRGIKPNAGGDDTSVNGPNPREANKYGQIVRWRPEGGDHAARGFDWDLYVMAGNPTVHGDAYGGSANVTPGNMFNSPDGMMFDQKGLLWIQTDGNDSNEGDFAGQGNNQMLVGDPVTGEIARFLTGPNGSEVTGITWSADRRTLFVGIQHPGGTFPDGAGLPRSCIVAVKRKDDAVIG
ncbi:PhoX family protein [Actibacterium sp. XHP0104]|uniref:PhoX family protein n=1 Tax=Actibacterium sp. XHP0104 TaxID=2984335 RepID=UPI0021E77624|nr:PhoX family phosphatase [Actibacterium sp. XHP0104]MCV2882850.1 PhoX family phosphatase [Actibacterium sp. XHP0104]